MIQLSVLRTGRGRDGRPRWWAGCALAAAATAAAAAGDAAEQQVQAEARSVLEERTAALADPRFELALVRRGNAPPPCPQGASVQGVDTRYPSRMRFALSCPGSAGWRVEYVVRATVSADVLVAAADVPAGRPLTAADLSLHRRDVTATPDAMSDAQAAAGRASRSALRAGELVRQSRLVAALLVRRGEAVRIVARRGAVEVSVPGEALEAGARGAALRVRNAATGNVIRARVTDAATVEPLDNDASMTSTP